MSLRSPSWEAIGQEVGTPALVFSARLLREQSEAFRAAAQVLAGARIYYSVKTNDHPRLVAALATELDGLELISGAELSLAAALSVDGGRLILNGPNKSERELERAVALGTHLIHLDGLADAQRLERVAQRSGRMVQVGVRLAFDADGTWSKFGVAPDSFELQGLSEMIRGSAHLRLVAVHYHGDHQLEPGAGIGPLLSRLRAQVERLRAQGHPVSTLDLGGGWDPVIALGPTGEWEQDGRTELALREVARHWDAWGSGAPSLILEPGRALVEGAVVALTRVGNVKQDRQRTFAYVDLSTGYVGGRHPCDRRIQVRLGADRPGPLLRQQVCGPLCTGSDVLGEISAPLLVDGDLLLIGNAGAYTLTLRYHSTQRTPGIVWLNEDGRFEVLRRPEGEL